MPTAASAPTVSPASVQWTVDAYLKRPQIIARDLTTLTAKRYVADRILIRGTADQVAGGTVAYQRSESIFLDPARDFEEVGVRSKWPRAGWSEDFLTDYVHQYGLEVPIGYLAIRRNARDISVRALRKLANNIVKFVDTKMFTAIAAQISGGFAQTTTAGASWAGGTTILADIAKARRLIAAADEGYEMDTVLLSLADEASALTNTALLGVLGREGPGNMATRGEVSQILGITNWISTPRLAQGTAYFIDSKIAGTIADEAPAPEEGFTTYDTGQPGQAPMYVRILDDPDNSQRVIRAMRSPAIWFAEPKAIVQMTAM